MNFLKLTIFSLLCFSAASKIEFKNWELGIGTLKEEVSRVEQEFGGEESFLKIKPFVRLGARTDFFFSHDFDLEFGITTPRSSRDSALKRMNYWVHFLPSYDTGYVYFNRFYYGVGLYYTRFSMDGNIQDLSEHGDSAPAYTPIESSTSTNLSFVMASDLVYMNKYSLNLQVMVLNPEDSLERAFNVLLALKHDFGKW